MMNTSASMERFPPLSDIGNSRTVIRSDSGTWPLPRKSPARDLKKAPGPAQRPKLELVHPYDRVIQDEISAEVFEGLTPEVVPQKQPRSHTHTESHVVHEPYIRPRDRVLKKAIVSADFKTNMLLPDEYEFLASLSRYLSVLYERPETSIFVSVQHTACILFQGSFDRCYRLTITALPTLTTTSKNRHNAALLQAFIDDQLDCPSSRGVVDFHVVGEDDLATGGTTLSGQIKRHAHAHSPAIGEQAPFSSGSTTPHQPKYELVLPPLPLSLKDRPLPQAPQYSVPTPPSSPSEKRSTETIDFPTSKDSSLRGRSKSVNGGGGWRKKKTNSNDTVSSIPAPDFPEVKSPMDFKAEKVRKLGKRRSLLNIWGKAKEGQNGVRRNDSLGG